MDFSDQVKSQTDIVEVIGEVVALRKFGQTYKGVCPFHGGKIEALNVNSALQYFKCPSCGKGGDVIQFVMQMDKIPFEEAVAKLASRKGISKPE